jgi:hypothetical protein
MDDCFLKKKLSDNVTMWMYIMVFCSGSSWLCVFFFQVLQDSVLCPGSIVVLTYQPGSQSAKQTAERLATTIASLVVKVNQHFFCVYFFFTGYCTLCPCSLECCTYISFKSYFSAQTSWCWFLAWRQMQKSTTQRLVKCIKYKDV